MSSISDPKYLPEYADLTIPELNLSTPILRAGALQLGLYCDHQCKEFILCRTENEHDPRQCLKEGSDLTACGIEFFQKVKSNCREEFEKFAHCTEHGSGEGYIFPCRKLQRVFDYCMDDKLGLQKPPFGYFSRPHVHVSDRPKPPPPYIRDYEKEAAEKHTQLPVEKKLGDDYRRYIAAEPRGWEFGFGGK